MLKRRGSRVRAVVLLGILAMAACGETTRAARGAFEPRAEGVLVVATDLPSPGFWEGESVDALDGGLELGIAEALAEQFDLDLRIVEVGFSQIVAGRLGEADLALAQVSITDERAADVEFSIPYFESSPAVLARVGETLRDLATARALRWVVLPDTTQAAYLAEVVRPEDEPLVVADMGEAALAVQGDEADAALLDLASALILAEDVGGLEAIARFDRSERYGVVLPDGPDNVDAVDTALRRLVADGSIEALADRWLAPRFAAPPRSLQVIAAR